MCVYGCVHAPLVLAFVCVPRPEVTASAPRSPPPPPPHWMQCPPPSSRQPGPSSSNTRVTVCLSLSRWRRLLHARQPARYGPGAERTVFRGVGSPHVCGGPGAGLVLFLLRAFRDHLLSLCGPAEAPSGRGPSHGGQRRRRGDRLGAARCLGLWGPIFS